MRKASSRAPSRCGVEWPPEGGYGAPSLVRSQTSAVHPAYSGGVVFQKILRAGEGKILRRLSKIADAVESLADETAALTDAELRAKTDEFKERYAEGESLDSLLPEAFAVVREAAHPHAGPAALPRAAHGRRRAAPGQRRRDEDR